MFNEEIKFKYTWRPYQEKVLAEVDQYIKDKKINIVAAPGSGKTVLGLELARRIGKPVLILSPTVTIKNQWIDRFVTLFMKEGSKRPEWISDNVYNLSYFNSITYQGLHYAYKRIKQKNENDTDDEIIEEKFDTDIDIETYDLIKEIRKNKIGTIILDEAHHLKNEWWQSLKNVKKSLRNITLISLTATPPYDVEYSEWKKYSSLCGEIDIEISVPELVAAKNLCPHQDYVYFSYPTEKEKDRILKYEKQVQEFIEYLKTNEEFINMLKNHPYIQSTRIYTEQILGEAEFYSSMLIFLNSINVNISSTQVRILGHDKAIPKLDISWLEVLLQNLIFSEKEYFQNYINIIDDIKCRLNKMGAIEKRKIMLSNNSKLQKYFINSISKLESINQIVESELENLSSDLRMVILTDFLRKEYLFQENSEINKMGAFPIFLNILKQNLNVNIAILTGSMFIIPVSQKTNLIEYAKEKGLKQEIIEFIPINKLEDYCIVKTIDKYKNILMSSISKLFSSGNVNIIIGTKSLLGEGWDEPSINSLILASYVGSYVLSNQMRGRAIRVNDNPNKTANIWHLVCVSDINKSLIKNSDFEMLQRRFNAFVGIGYKYKVLENGIDRLDLIPDKFSKEKINIYNKEVISISNNRKLMYDKWFELINENGGTDIKIVNQLETKKTNLRNSFSIIRPTEILGFLTTCLALLVIATFMFEKIKIFTIIGIIINLKFLYKCIKAVILSIPAEQFKIVALVVVKSLCESNIIQTQYGDIIINLEEQDKINLRLSIGNVTTHENNIIIKSIKEVFSEIENQRYLIVNEKRGIMSFYNVPEVIAEKKSTAEIFYNNWNKYIGNAKLVYTNSEKGRKVLLKARANSFNYTNIKKFIEKKKPISHWK